MNRVLIIDITPRQGDKETGRQGDTGTRGQGDWETRGHGDTENLKTRRTSSKSQIPRTKR